MHASSWKSNMEKFDLDLGIKLAKGMKKKKNTSHPRTHLWQNSLLEKNVRMWVLQIAPMHDGLDWTPCSKLPDLWGLDADSDLKFPLGLFSLKPERSSFPTETVPDTHLHLLPLCTVHLPLRPFSVYVRLRNQVVFVLPRHGVLQFLKNWATEFSAGICIWIFLNKIPDKAHPKLWALRNHA